MNKTGLYSLVVSIAFAIPFGLATVETPSVIAQDRSGTNMTKEEGEETVEAKAVSDLMLAQRLAAYGRENNTATALISAAQIVLDTPTQNTSFDKTSETDESNGSAAETRQVDEINDQSPELSASKLLADAKQIASGDQNLLSLIANLEDQAVSKGSARGRTRGPAKDVDAVSRYSSIYYTIRFRGSRVARVGVKGNGNTDLDCYIYDGNGNLIVSDTDSSDACLVEWVPYWTGPFRVRIRNRGGVYNRYVMMTN